MRSPKDINRTKNRRANLCALLELFLCFSIVYAIIFGNPSLASLCFALSFLVLLLFFLLHITAINFRELDKLSSLLLVIITVVSLFVLVGFLSKDVSFDLTYFQPVLLFLEALLWFYLASQYSVNQKTEAWLFLFSTAIALAYPLWYYFLPKGLQSTVGYDFNFGNPNFASLCILPSAMMMVLAAIRYRGLLRKVFFLVLATLDAHMLLKTGSRNVQIALFVFLLLIFLIRIRRNFAFSRTLLFFTSALPILCVPFYLQFLDLALEKGWFSFWISDGKPLTSRFNIWNSLLERLGGNWLIGDYAHIRGNWHNSHLVVLGSYGVIVLVLVIIFTYILQRDLRHENMTLFEKCSLAAFVAAMLTGVGEGGIFSGALCAPLLFGVPLFFLKKPQTTSSTQPLQPNS